MHPIACEVSTGTPLWNVPLTTRAGDKLRTKSATGTTGVGASMASLEVDGKVSMGTAGGDAPFGIEDGGVLIALAQLPGEARRRSPAIQACRRHHPCPAAPLRFGAARPGTQKLAHRGVPFWGGA